MKKVEIENKRVLFKDIFTITETNLRFEQFNERMSQPTRRLVFERGDSVAALLLNRDTQHVILIEQFRYPTYEKGPGWLCEVVAGMIDEGEQPEDAMRREIHEEIGYQAHELTHIATFYVSPGGSSERILLYYAEVGTADRVAPGGFYARKHLVQPFQISPRGRGGLCLAVYCTAAPSLGLDRGTHTGDLRGSS